jgi:hypothetical protein
MMDEQTRTHCRVDLHKVQDGLMTPAVFMRKWTSELSELLLSEEVDDLSEELKNAEDYATNAEQERDGFQSACETALQKLDDIESDVTKSDALAAINEAATILDKALNK